MVWKGYWRDEGCDERSRDAASFVEERVDVVEARADEVENQS